MTLQQVYLFCKNIGMDSLVYKQNHQECGDMDHESSREFRIYPHVYDKPLCDDRGSSLMNTDQLFQTAFIYLHCSMIIDDWW